MGRLSEVTEELAIRLQSEVEIGKHIQGTRATPMSGGLPVILTNLQEAQEFLYIASPETLKVVGGHGFVNYLDLHKLTTWIAEVFGDQELANAIGEEIDKGSSYASRIVPVKQLIEERLQQCKTLLESKKPKAE